MIEDTLLKHIETKTPLTEQERLSLYGLLCHGCRKHTKDRLYNIIVKYGMIYDRYGIYGRVMFENGEARYYTGQSYPDEIRTVRDLILGRIS